VLREVPLGGLVDEIAEAVAEFERDHGRRLLCATHLAGDRKGMAVSTPTRAFSDCKDGPSDSGKVIAFTPVESTWARPSPKVGDSWPSRMNSSPSARAGKLGTLTRYPDLRTDQGKQRLLRFTSSHGLPTCPKDPQSVRRGGLGRCRRS
jgi:hypothetical protein